MESDTYGAAANIDIHEKSENIAKKMNLNHQMHGENLIVTATGRKIISTLNPHAQEFYPASFMEKPKSTPRSHNISNPLLSILRDDNPKLLEIFRDASTCNAYPSPSELIKNDITMQEVEDLRNTGTVRRELGKYDRIGKAISPPPQSPPPIPAHAHAHSQPLNLMDVKKLEAITEHIKIKAEAITAQATKDLIETMNEEMEEVRELQELVDRERSHEKTTKELPEVDEDDANIINEEPEFKNITIAEAEEIYINEILENQESKEKINEETVVRSTGLKISDSIEYIRAKFFESDETESTEEIETKLPMCGSSEVFKQRDESELISISAMKRLSPCDNKYKHNTKLLEDGIAPPSTPTGFLEEVQVEKKKTKTPRELKKKSEKRGSIKAISRIAMGLSRKQTGGATTSTAQTATTSVGAAIAEKPAIPAKPKTVQKKSPIEPLKGLSATAAKLKAAANKAAASVAQTNKLTAAAIKKPTITTTTETTIQKPKTQLRPTTTLCQSRTIRSRAPSAPAQKIQLESGHSTARSRAASEQKHANESGGGSTMRSRATSEQKHAHESGSSGGTTVRHRAPSTQNKHTESGVANIRSRASSTQKNLTEIGPIIAATGKKESNKAKDNLSIKSATSSSHKLSGNSLRIVSSHRAPPTKTTEKAAISNVTTPPAAAAATTTETKTTTTKEVTTGTTTGAAGGPRSTVASALRQSEAHKRRKLFPYDDESPSNIEFADFLFR